MQRTLVHIAHWRQNGVCYRPHGDGTMTALCRLGLAVFHVSYDKYGRDHWRLTEGGWTEARRLGAETEVPEDFDERLERGEYD